MRILLFLSDLMIPLLFFYIIGFGLLMKKDIYNDFVTGAFDGLKIVVKIMPTLIGLMTGVGILRASGFLDALASLLENLLKPTGFPSALVPLCCRAGCQSRCRAKSEKALSRLDFSLSDNLDNQDFKEYISFHYLRGCKP